MNEDHHPQCPLNQDYELTEKEQERIDPAELLDLVRAAGQIDNTYISRGNLLKALKPFGYLLECECAEIAESYKEKAAEDRAERC